MTGVSSDDFGLCRFDGVLDVEHVESGPMAEPCRG